MHVYAGLFSCHVSRQGSVALKPDWHVTFRVHLLPLRLTGPKLCTLTWKAHPMLSSLGIQVYL